MCFDVQKIYFNDNFLKKVVCTLQAELSYTKKLPLGNYLIRILVYKNLIRITLFLKNIGDFVKKAVRETIVHNYFIEFTQRTNRVLRAIDQATGRVKIDIKETSKPFDTLIVDAWVVEKDGVLWLEHETGAGYTQALRLATALRFSRQPKL